MKLVKLKKTSARVRFFMQDVIELRQNGWKKRREDAGPKTIDQIHKEVEKDQMEQKLQHMTSSMGLPPARRQKFLKFSSRLPRPAGGHPKFWDFLAQIISPVFPSNCVNKKILLTSADGADWLMSDELPSKCAAGRIKHPIIFETKYKYF